MKSAKSFFLVLLAAFAVVACSEFEDQRFEPGTKAWQVVNPPLGPEEEIIRSTRAHEVVVAVLDSGVDYGHPAIRRNMHYNLDEVVPYLRGESFGRDNDRNGITDDFLGWDFAGADGIPSYRLYSLEQDRRVIEVELEGSMSHGTHVSGIVAQGDPRIGIMPFRMMPTPPGAKSAADFAETLAENMRQAIYMAKRAGARVVNMSLGINSNKEIPEAVLKKAFKGLQRYLKKAAHDMIIVIAAGNETLDISNGAKIYPCQLRVGNVICVGSVNDQGEISEFSNRGLQFVDIFAPGEDIRSTVPRDLTKDPDGFEPMSGTSMASPYVAHVAARMLIANPCLGARQVLAIMQDTAERKKAPMQLGNSKRAEYRYLVVDKRAAERAARYARCEE